jgi:hypothetical protein
MRLYLRILLLIDEMDETADGPQRDQGPEAGHGGFEKYTFPEFTEPGGYKRQRE